jgi:hypothetical protein
MEFVVLPVVVVDGVWVWGWCMVWQFLRGVPRGVIESNWRSASAIASNNYITTHTHKIHGHEENDTYESKLGNATQLQDKHIEHQTETGLSAM